MSFALAHPALPSPRRDAILLAILPSPVPAPVRRLCLRRLPPLLVLCRRGAIVDEEALYNALKSKSIGGAVLDVWWNDIFRLPDGGVGPSSWPSKFPFNELPNVVVRGHADADAPLLTRTRRCLRATAHASLLMLRCSYLLTRLLAMTMVVNGFPPLESLHRLDR